MQTENFNKEEVEEALSKAMMQLMRSKQQAYITSVLLSLPRVITHDVPTAGVDGIRILVNPDFFMGLPDNERRFLLVHEAWHIGLMDVVRRGDKDPSVWNEACDHYINIMIDDQKDPQLKFIELGCKNNKYRGWEKEGIYQDLLKNPRNRNKSKLSGDLSPDVGGDSGSGSPKQLSPAEQKELEKQISNIVQQAAMRTKMMGGKVPTDVEKYLDKLYNPRLPWEKLLMKYMSGITNEDYSYQRINKSFFPHGIILPTLFGEGLGRIAIANDSSCSVSDEEFKTYLGAIKDIKEKLNPEQIDVVNFTTEIEQQWVIKEDEDISKIQFRASGGTDLYPVFEHFTKQENRPQVLIVFSDLECTPIQNKPPFDVIWICVNNKRAEVKFGKKIDVEVK